MLKTLNIENIAVIQKAVVEFSNGLNVLTGETGAGKSIVVDSINAILGERTSRELVRHGADSAFVSACFEDISKSVVDRLSELDIPCEEDGGLLLSRKITAGGKSSCKINGRPVTVSMLKEIGSFLVNIHGQHDSQALLNPDLHYKYIDMLSDNAEILAEYKTAFKELIAVRRKLKSLTLDEESKDRQLELLEYQIRELEEANVQIGEREALQSRRSFLNNSQRIADSVYHLLGALSGDEEYPGITAVLHDSYQQFSVIPETENISQELIDLIDRTESIKDHLEKILAEANYDPDEAEWIDERLDILFRLSNKYGSTEQEMLDFLEGAKAKRRSILFADEELERLNAEYDLLFEKTVSCAQALSEHRRKTAAAFEKAVKDELLFLDMPKIQFKVDFQKGNLSSTGFDKIEFLIVTNPGEPLKPMARIASGGELSRIMLAIKNIIARNDTVDTLIFDEIDTGVSGKTSQKIGLKLKSVSKETQVICVTHSAQIASNADGHFKIVKTFSEQITYTNVIPLDFEGRKQELARIMGGLEITDALLKSAEELLTMGEEI